MNYPQIEKSIEVIKKLHHPTEGCPWDLAQTHKSLLKYLIEESYEFIEACEIGDPKMMEEELGDVLLQVLHHGVMAEKEGLFSLETIASKLSDKMIRRHPHVFGKSAEEKLDAQEVVNRWQEIKKIEKGESKKYSIEKKLLLAPALESSYRIGEKSKTVNFDWDDYYQVMEKVEEEWQEVKEELPPGGSYDIQRVQEEIGDLLFSVAQLARHLDLNPEECLRKANAKFIDRFQKVEDLVLASGKMMEQTPQSELEKFWIKVKAK